MFLSQPRILWLLPCRACPAQCQHLFKISTENVRKRFWCSKIQKLEQKLHTRKRMGKIPFFVHLFPKLQKPSKLPNPSCRKGSYLEKAVRMDSANELTVRHSEIFRSQWISNTRVSANLHAKTLPWTSERFGMWIVPRSQHGCVSNIFRITKSFSSSASLYLWNELVCYVQKILSSWSLFDRVASRRCRPFHRKWWCHLLCRSNSR